MKLYKRFKHVWKTYKHTEAFLGNPFYIIGNKTVRRIFIAPKMKLSCGAVKNQLSWTNALFGIYSCPVYYINKFNERRLEEEPFVQINLFGLYLRAELKCPYDTMSKYGYWESILQLYCDYVCTGKPYNLYNILLDNTWRTYRKRPPEKEDFTLFLTNAGYALYCADMAAVIV